MKAHNGENENMNDKINSGMYGKNTSKIDRYGWANICDGKGELKWIDKSRLHVDLTYQRESNNFRAQDIASDWSWVACGVIVINDRDGVYYVIDGQHRVLAAMKRIDIDLLPCLVFREKTVKDEAVGFYTASTKRANISALQKYKTLLVMDDPDAVYMDDAFKKLGIKVMKNANGPMQLKSVSSLYKIKKRDTSDFDKLITLLAEICDNESPVTQALIGGLDHIGRRIDLNDQKLRKRIKTVGAIQLDLSAKKGAAIAGSTGYTGINWANGMMSEINKHVKTQNRIELPISIKQKGDDQS